MLIFLSLSLYIYIYMYIYILGKGKRRKSKKRKREPTLAETKIYHGIKKERQPYQSGRHYTNQSQHR